MGFRTSICCARHVSAAGAILSSRARVRCLLAGLLAIVAVVNFAAAQRGDTAAAGARPVFSMGQPADRKSVV